MVGGKGLTVDQIWGCRDEWTARRLGEKYVLLENLIFGTHICKYVSSLLSSLVGL